MRPFLLALALITALPAAAQDFLEPPPEYNRPFPGGTTVRYFTRAEMWDQCNTLAMRTMPIRPAECGKWRWVLNGKMLREYRDGAKKRCFVYISEIFQGTETAEKLIRHGRAHCLGWVHAIRRSGQE